MTLGLLIAAGVFFIVDMAIILPLTKVGLIDAWYVFLFLGLLIICGIGVIIRIWREPV